MRCIPLKVRSVSDYSYLECVYNKRAELGWRVGRIFLLLQAVVFLVEIDTPSKTRHLKIGNESFILKTLEFGKELNATHKKLKEANGTSVSNDRLLQVSQVAVFVCFFNIEV